MVLTVKINEIISTALKAYLPWQGTWCYFTARILIISKLYFYKLYSPANARGTHTYEYEL